MGDEAIASGAIVPLYPLEEDDYEFIQLDAVACGQPDGAVGDACLAGQAAQALADAQGASLDPERDPAPASAPVAWQFTHSGLPLSVTSGVLVASDLMNLISWEYAAYADYQRQSAGPGHQRPQDDMDVPPGHYALAISGGRDGAGHKVFGLRFERVAQLPQLQQGQPGQCSDAFDFEIV